MVTMVTIVSMVTIVTLSVLIITKPFSHVMVPDSDTPDDSLVSSPHPATDDPSYHGNPTLHNPPEPSSPKPLLRRISESLESRKVLLRTWSVNNVGSQSPSLLERLGGLSVWASTPAVSSTQDNVSSTQDTPATQEQEEEERRDKPEYDVVVEEDSPDEDIPLPDPRTMSLSRKSNIVSLNSKMKRSMSSLSLFKAPRIRRKRKKGGLGKGIEPQTL